MLGQADRQGRHHRPRVHGAIEHGAGKLFRGVQEEALSESQRMHQMKWRNRIRWTAMILTLYAIGLTLNGCSAGLAQRWF